MNYLKYVKKVYKVLPENYKSKTILYLGLSFFNLLLEILSLAIFIPLIIMIVNKETPSSSGIINSFLNQKTIFENPVLLIGFIFLIILVFILKNVVSIKIINYQMKISFQLATDFSAKFTQNYIYNDFVSFKKQAKAEAIRNSIEVPNEFVTYVLFALNTILSELVLLSFILVAGLIINLKITLILFLIFCVSVFIAQGIGNKKIRLINNNLAGNYSKNITNLLNLLNGFFEIKTSNSEQLFLNRFKKSNETLNKTYAVLHSQNLTASKYIEVLILIIIGSIIFFNNYQSQEGYSNIFYISFLAAAAMKVIPSINKIITQFLNFRSHLFTVDIIEENLGKSQQQLSQTGTSLVFNKNIRLENIRFSYNSQPLLEKINLSIKKGEIIAIIGNSGIGKSTLLHILTQFIEPKNGKIFVDDQLINLQNKNAFLGLLSYVQQTPFILDGSILENITMYNSLDNGKLMRQLLKDFELKEIIDELPQQINTYIGNDGHYLSGGQKQRVALIRALLSLPQILILDEATNQLEKNLEVMILEKLKEIARKKQMTVILVSHHITNIACISDNIYELSAGRLKLVKN